MIEEMAMSPHETTPQNLETLRDMDAWLLDFDGTLQHGEKQELHARLGDIALQLDMDVSAEEISQFANRSDYREMRQLMVETHNQRQQDHPLTEQMFQAINMEVTGTHDDKLYVADFVKELLPGIKDAGKVLGLVTTRGPVSIFRVLRRHGIADYFDTVVNRDDCEQRKPHPEPILMALGRLGVENPSQAVMVGDKQEDDVAAGQNAGTRTVLVNPVMDLAKAQPDFHVSSLQPLAELFNS